MNDHRFEQLILVVGAAAILGSLALSFSQGIPDTVEIVAQLMVFGVLVAALRAGRRGGLVAAIAATAIYLFMRLPRLEVPMHQADIVTLAARTAAFGLVGIGVGELFGRMRYVFAGIESTSAIDEWSHVYSQSHACGSVSRALGRFERYEEEFSVVLVTLSGSVFAGLRPLRQRSVVRTVAALIRDDVRLVDEVARLNDGRFLILLPHTPRAGAQVVASRLHPAVAKVIGARAEAIGVQVLGTPSDVQALRMLLDALNPGGDDQDPSGRYNDAASSTRNPAA